MEWWALTKIEVELQREAHFLEHTAVGQLRKAAAAHCFGCGHAQQTQSAEPIDDLAGNVRAPIDFRRIERFIAKNFEVA